MDKNWQILTNTHKVYDANEAKFVSIHDVEEDVLGQYRTHFEKWEADELAVLFRRSQNLHHHKLGELEKHFGLTIYEKIILTEQTDWRSK
jgi:hypothetical protein